MTQSWPAFEQALKRSAELETLLGDPAVIGDRARYTQTAKEHGSLAKMVKPYLEYQKVAADVAQAEAMRDDPDMADLAAEELAALKPRLDALRTRLEDLLL